MKQQVQPMDTVPLFEEMREELLRVLNSLNDIQWQQPTACEGWTVKDVALHILGDDIGYVSRHRDQDGITLTHDSWDELVEKLNIFNEQWVTATRRISKNLLISLLEFTGKQVNDYFVAQMESEENVTIAWAGEVPMWLQVARELTEYWMHHQHICEAVDIDSLKGQRFMVPVLTAFVHALPVTFQEIHAPLETLVRLQIENMVDFDLVSETNGWKLYSETNLDPQTTVRMPVQIAWKLFTKGISPEAARQQSMISGDINLGKQVFNTVAIIA